MKKLLVFILLVMFPIITLAYPKGDVNGNNKVDSEDYILVRKHILKQSNLTGDKLGRADVNNDGKVNTNDYIEIRKTIINGVTVTPTPSSNVTITPTPGVTPTKKVSITATNEPCQVVLTANVDSSIKLASKAYSWDGKKTWTNSKTFVATEKKSYRLYVKDKSGQIYSSDLYKVEDLNTPKNLKNGIINSKEFNLVKGISSNITKEIAVQNTINFNKALQCAHNSGIKSLKVEKGKYYFDKNMGKHLVIDYSNLTLDLNSSEFYIYPGSNYKYSLIVISGENRNIVIKNGTLKGDRYQHKCVKGTWTCGKFGFECQQDAESLSGHTTHEYGHGITIGHNSVTIENMNISDMMGDGIYINTGRDTNATKYVDKIYIYKNTIENNRRQGISIIGGKNITIKNNIIRYTNGTAPQAGIDLERNQETQFYEKVTIDGNTIYGNYSRHSVYICAGIKDYLKITNNKLGEQVTYQAASNSKVEKDKITIKGNSIYKSSGVDDCVCNPNTIVTAGSSECTKCNGKKCVGTVVNGTVQK